MNLKLMNIRNENEIQNEVMGGAKTGQNIDED